MNLILGLSILLRLAGAVYACAVWRRQRARPMLLLGVFGLLLALRPVGTLYLRVADGPSDPARWIVEVPALITSAGFVVAVLLVGWFLDERRRREQSLRQSEGTVRSIAESCADYLLLLDLDYRIRFINRTVPDLTREGVTGQSILPHIPERFHARVLACYEHVRSTQQPASFDTEYDSPEGVRYFESNVSPVIEGDRVTGLTVVARDVTESRRLQEDLRQAKELTEHIVRAAPMLILCIDASGAITRVNPAVEAITGYRENEVLGRAWWSLFADDDDRRRLLERWDPSDRRPVVDLDATIVTRDGSLRTLSWNSVDRHDAEGRLLERIGIGVDVTERERVARERQRLAEQLRDSQRIESLGRLAGSVAHDFSNLLTAILGNLDSARTALGSLPPSPETERVASSLAQVALAAGQASSVTRQLLTLSLRHPGAAEVVDARAAVAAMEDLLRRLIGERVRIVIDVAFGTPHVRLDEGQLEQIVLNLLVNARDAMPDGGTVRVTTRASEVAADVAARYPSARPGKHMLLTVTDDGVGMAPEILDRIFEPFFTTKPAGKGTGLGLATVYAIVTQSGGHLDVDSAPGRGSTFRIWLPAVESPRVGAPPAEPIVGRGAHETVLVCEDEALVREILCQTLRERGYQVLEARHGEEAVRLARDHTGPIQLLVTDVVMPGLNGREVAMRILDTRPRTRVLYVSGYTSDIIDVPGVRSVAQDFLQKPFTPSFFARRVRELLDRAGAAATDPTPPLA